MARSRMRTLGEALGVLAVVASMVLVAIEINQANKIAASAMLFDLMSLHNSWHQETIQNPELAEFLATLQQSDGHELSPAEVVRARAFVMKNLNAWSAPQSAYDNGLLPRQDFQTYLEAVASHRVAYVSLGPYYQEAFLDQPR